MEKTIEINLFRYLYNIKEDKFYKIMNALIIGRSKGNITFIEDKAMSGVHAKILIKHGEVSIEDLKSTNGIRVNNKRISISKPTIVLLGSSIEIGEQSFILTDQDFERPQIKTYIENTKPKNAKLFSLRLWTLQTKLFFFLFILSYFPPIYFFWEKDKIFFVLYYFIYSILTIINFIYNLKNSYTDNNLSVAILTILMWTAQIFISVLSTYLIYFVLF